MGFGRDETQKDLHFRSITPEARWRENFGKKDFTALGSI